MFSASAKAHYGVDAMVHLAEQFGEGLVQIREIAERRRIPKNYLEQIFNRLNKHGLVKSVRGKKGGYQLGDLPENISVLSILEALEGPIEIGGKGASEAMSELYRDIEEHARNTLGISLAHLLRMQRDSQQRVMFHI